MPKPAICHPDLPVLAKGLCGPCYQHKYYETHKERWCENPKPPREPKPATCHPDRPAVALGLCKNCYQQRYRRINKDRLAKRRKELYKENPERRLAREKDWHRRNPERYLLGLARRNARKTGRECAITKDDVIIPKVCPVLGIPIDVFLGHADNCATVDRVDSNLGYVPGNFAVISCRANVLKSDGTAEEHRRIADWMDSVLGKR